MSSRSPLLLFSVWVGLFGGCASFPFRVAHADATTPTAPHAPAVIRDLIWAWGNPEMAEPGEHTAASFAQASPFQRARLLGAPNIMMGGHGLPGDDREGDRLTREVLGLDRILWEIGPDNPPGPPFVYTKRMEQVRKLAEKYPKIEGVVLDDMSTTGIDNGFKPVHIRQIRALLPGECSRVKIWGGAPPI
jgi:hypothetical protein